MLEENFSEIKYFTADEIKKTGADIKDVQLKTIMAIDQYRKFIGQPVYLADNGITSGGHKAEEHPKGLAIDNYVKREITADQAVKCALMAGFRGIGVYWNGIMYSFHFDLREKFEFWTGKKVLGGPSWTYGRLIIDPRHMFIKKG